MDRHMPYSPWENSNLSPYDNMPYKVKPYGTHLLNTLEDCEATCEHMTTYIKGRKDVDKRTKQLKLLRDCADICGLTSKFIARKSCFAREIAGLCSYICECCARECMKYSDPESQNCAAICMNCSRECKAFSVM